jgi:hypothetical protein
MMVPPRKVKFMAKKKLNENMMFRTFLKCNVDREELDKQFLHLHNELFEHYDCNGCRNCCKQYYGSITCRRNNEGCRLFEYGGIRIY